MSRTLSSAMQSVMTAEVVRPIILIECDFDTAPLNLWNGVGSLVHNAKTYVGAGNLLSVGGVSENSELTANGTSITLTGVNATLASLARDEDYQGRSIIIKLGAMDENADVIADPVQLFAGFMDVMTINDGAEFSTINVTCENKLISFDRSKIRRYTDQDQKINYPNDKGFEFVNAIQKMDIKWGTPTSGSGGSGRSGGEGTGRTTEAFNRY